MGVHESGSLMVWGWGRRDLGQLAVLPQNPAPALDVEAVSVGSSTATAPNSLEPRWLATALPSLPRGSVREVWCGGESTLACCEDGLLWATGWNEHGNLGEGGSGIAGSRMTWTEVRDKSGVQVRLADVWEGAAGCGGGHTLAVVRAL